MPDRSPPRRRLFIVVAASIAASGGAASLARAQQATGSIGASLTILAPIAAQPRVTSFDLGRDGVVRIEGTVPELAGAQRDSGAGGMSELVLARVSSSTVAFTPDAQPPASLGASGGELRLLHVVKLRRISRALDTHTVELRVEYVIFAGT